MSGGVGSANRGGVGSSNPLGTASGFVWGAAAEGNRIPNPTEVSESLDNARKGKGATKKVAQLQSALKVSRVMGLTCVAVGTVSYCVGVQGGISEIVFGAALLGMGKEGSVILANMKEILENSSHYKEKSSGEWKIQDIGKRLKKDVYLSGWIIDHFIIPNQFGNI